MRTLFNLLIFCASLAMFGCPSKDPEPEQQDNRTSLPTDGFFFAFGDPSDTTRAAYSYLLPEVPTCDKSVEFQNIKFSLRAATSEESPQNQRCAYITYYKGGRSIFINSGGAMVVDVSKYKGLKFISLNLSQYCSGATIPSYGIFFYDLDGKLITKQDYGESNRTTFYDKTYNKPYDNVADFSRLGQVVIVNRCETSISSIEFYPH